MERRHLLVPATAEKHHHILMPSDTRIPLLLLSSACIALAVPTLTQWAFGTSAAPSQRSRLLFTTDILGYLEPCG